MKLLFALFTVLFVTIVSSEGCDSFTGEGGAYSLAALNGKTFSATLTDDKPYNYEFAVCSNTLSCNPGSSPSSALCQSWGDNKVSLGKFSSVSADSTGEVKLSLLGGDEIVGRGQRSCNVVISCDASVAELTLDSVVYTGSGAAYKATAKSAHACPAGGAGVVILIILIILVLGGVGGAVYWFVIKPRQEARI